MDSHIPLTRRLDIRGFFYSSTPEPKPRRCILRPDTSLPLALGSSEVGCTRKSSPGSSCHGDTRGGWLDEQGSRNGEGKWSSREGRSISRRPPGLENLIPPGLRNGKQLHNNSLPSTYCLKRTFLTIQDVSDLVKCVALLQLAISRLNGQPGGIFPQRVYFVSSAAIRTDLPPILRPTVCPGTARLAMTTRHDSRPDMCRFDSLENLRQEYCTPSAIFCVTTEEFDRPSATS